MQPLLWPALVLPWLLIGALTWLLAEQGLDATLAHPPRSVEYALQWRTPDVLLVDGDDADLTALVKRLARDDRFAHMRVIIAARRDENGIGRVPVGAHDCVEKPYRAHEVLNRVAAQLHASAELASAREVLQDARGQVERARDSSASNRRLAEVLRDVADELRVRRLRRCPRRRPPPTGRPSTCRRR